MQHLCSNRNEIGRNVTDLQAYRAIFHYIGAIDENVHPRRLAGAYAERLADSHDFTSPPPDPSAWQEMWV